MQLKAFEIDVLLVFFFHSMDTRTYLKNMRSSDEDIYMFYNGRVICRGLFTNKEKYEKAFDKLVKLKFIKDWIDFQHLTHEGLAYISNL